MIWYLGKYLRHYFFRRHRNGHHIHSPYVFEFVNSVVFGGTSREYHSQEALVRRIRGWAGAPNPGCFKIKEMETLEIRKAAQQFEVLILEEPYGDKVVHKRWKELVNMKEVRVSIDLFHVGILLLRRDLHKVHYRIKI